jgi:uncharacterized protein YndB with AHSA1/START domain
MEIDIGNVLGSVTRTVQNFEKDGRPASTVTLTRLYDTNVDDLWDALTNAQRIRRWFLPIEGDLKLGGRYQLEGNAGGTITACKPPRQLAATWEFGGKVSWIEVKVAADRGKVRLTLEHSAILEDHWNQFGPGAVGIGWDLAVMGLGRHIATGASADHAAAGAWMRSPHGKEFMTQSGELWRAAHVLSSSRTFDNRAVTAAPARRPRRKCFRLQNSRHSQPIAHKWKRARLADLDGQRR